jgi:hypothetical protein
MITMKYMTRWSKCRKQNVCFSVDFFAPQKPIYHQYPLKLWFNVISCFSFQGLSLNKLRVLWWTNEALVLSNDSDIVFCLLFERLEIYWCEKESKKCSMSQDVNVDLAFHRRKSLRTTRQSLLIPSIIEDIVKFGFSYARTWDFLLRHSSRNKKEKRNLSVTFSFHLTLKSRM